MISSRFLTILQVCNQTHNARDFSPVNVCKDAACYYNMSTSPAQIFTYHGCILQAFLHNFSSSFLSFGMLAVPSSELHVAVVPLLVSGSARVY